MQGIWPETEVRSSHRLPLSLIWRVGASLPWRKPTCESEHPPDVGQSSANRQGCWVFLGTKKLGLDSQQPQGDPSHVTESQDASPSGPDPITRVQTSEDPRTEQSV